MFDGITYFKTMAEHNKLVNANDFLVSECSGLEAIEPMMDNYQTKANFVLIDDTIDGSLVSNGAGFFNRRIFTVSIIARHEYNNLADRNVKLNLCREIYRQFLSRLIIDADSYAYSDALVYMRTNILQYREMNTYSLDGATGVTFMLPIDEPTDLVFQEDEWQ